MTAVVELAGVSVVRGGQRLLSDVDWYVEDDERWVVLGGNGAAKTTLLQVVGAQLHPTIGVAGCKILNWHTRRIDQWTGSIDLSPRSVTVLEWGA